LGSRPGSGACPQKKRNSNGVENQHAAGDGNGFDSDVSNLGISNSVYLPGRVEGLFHLLDVRQHPRKRGEGTWDEFLKQHAASLWQTDCTSDQAPSAFD